MRKARETLLDEAPERACYSCGQATRSNQVRILPDLLRGEGAEHVYGVCDDCQTDPTRRVLADLFGIAEDDPLVVAVDLFSDAPLNTPDKPATAWSHLDRDGIARRIADWRKDNEARKGGPCSFCGVGWTPPGTQWRRVGGSQALAWCHSCQERLGGRDTRTDEARSYAAAVLCGFEQGGAVTVPRMLGASVGLVWWHETGRSKANREPFAHLDIPGMRRQVSKLADQKALRLPAKWAEDRKVKW